MTAPKCPLCDAAPELLINTYRCNACGIEFAVLVMPRKVPESRDQTVDGQIQTCENRNGRNLLGNRLRPYVSSRDATPEDSAGPCSYTTRTNFRE